MHPALPAVLAGLDHEVVVAPASSGQRGMWLSHQLDRTGSAYHVTKLLELHGPLDTERLRNSFTAVVRRHEALRTSFTRVGGELRQLIHPTAELPFTVTHDALPAAVRQALAGAFDLTAPPLLRVHLFVCGAEHHLLAMVAHHLICDAPSVRRLWAEVAEQYRPDNQDADAPPPLQFADYADWESEWLTGDDYVEHLAYFRDQLADTPRALDLPLPVYAETATTGTVTSDDFPVELTMRLDEVARSLRVTPFMLMVTLFGGVLHRWTGDDAIVIGTPVSLRDSGELDTTVGMLLNSLPLVTRWPDSTTFGAASARIRDTVVAALQRRQCPFDQLVQDLRPGREEGRSPIFQVFFSLVPEADAPVTLSGLSVRELPPPPGPAKFELTLNVTAGRQLRCDLEWSARRFTADTAHAFLRHLRIAAEAVAADPDTPIAQWPLAESSATGLAELLGTEVDPITGRSSCPTPPHDDLDVKA
ncbi:condensation domain-containing protein [Micromonospora sp. NPDC049051]|uniref:condensation domain-containing protein n=1 Tax=Micromonospora sp. NPDC049051 TaxID=3364264 RepID=UPI00370FBE2C